MLRISALFVAVCMVLIAGAGGAVLYLVFGLGGMESLIVAIAALTAMALYNTVTTRLRDRAEMGDQIADLEETINRADVDMVIIATPIDLGKLIHIQKPHQRVRYEYQDIGTPTLATLLQERFGQ